MNKRGAIKKACDQCNRRRVKCDGQRPCRTCVKGSVECTFDKPVRRKGPAPNPEGRRRVRRKQQQQQSSTASPQPTVANALPGPSTFSSTQCPVATQTFATETSEYRCPSIFPEYQAVNGLAQTNPQSESFLDRPTFIDPIPLSQTWETNKHDVGSSYSNNNIDYGQLQIGNCPIGSPPLAVARDYFRSSQQCIENWSLRQQDVEPVRYEQHLAEPQNNNASQSLGKGKGKERQIIINAPSDASQVSKLDEETSLPLLSVSSDVTCIPNTSITTAPTIAPLDLLTAMPCDDSKWEELFAQMIASRPASPFKLMDVDPFSDMSFAFTQGGMQQSGWGRTGASLSPRLALGAGSAMGMPTNGSALTIPNTPTGQLVPNERNSSPMFTLCLDSLIRPQIEIFFSRIAPMIPVFSVAYIQMRLNSLSHDKDFVGLVLAMTALSLVHPLNVEEARQRPSRVRQAQILMDEALRLRDGWQFGSTSTVESIMTSYLMFGTLYEMGYAAGAKLRLREAVSLGETMGLHDPRSYKGLSRAEVLRRLKTYWVLSVTERAYSLQHSGGIVFEGSISTEQILPANDLADINDDESTSPCLRYLAQLFSFIDQDIVTCWNGRCGGPSCRCLTEERVIEILSKLGGCPSEVFGHDFDIQLRTLAESQQADLLITWQWLRNRMWRLAFLHGLAREGGPMQLSRVYLANVASATLDICKDLSTSSMDAHGAGFMQKLYDIASAIPELLRHDFFSEPRIFTPAQTVHLCKIVQQLYSHVARYRAGDSEFVRPLAEAISLATLTVVQE